MKGCIDFVLKTGRDAQYWIFAKIQYAGICRFILAYTNIDITIYIGSSDLKKQFIVCRNNFEVERKKVNNVCVLLIRASSKADSLVSVIKKCFNLKYTYKKICCKRPQTAGRTLKTHSCLHHKDV